jgi:hypothetical protein
MVCPFDGSSEACLGGDAAGVYGVLEGVVVAFVLVGVGLGEGGQRAVVLMG